MKNPFDRPDDFSPKELMIGAGIKTGVYNQWLYRGLFSASTEADGPGTVSSYTFKDIMVVAVLKLLKDMDIRLKKASKLARAIIDIDSPTVWVDLAKGRVENEDNNRTAVLRINVESLSYNVCGRIEEM